jgi:hypothetical protein
MLKIKNLKEEIMMRIENSNVKMQSEHNLVKSHVRTEFFKFYQTEMERDREIGKKSVQSLIDEMINNQLELLPGQAGELQNKYRVMNANTIVFEIRQTDSLRAVLEKLLKLLNEMGFQFTRRDYPGGLQLSIPAQPERPTDFKWNNQFEFERRDNFREAETLRFNAAGTVETGDHREIFFDTQLYLARDHQTTQTVKLKGNNLNDLKLIDPLVINYQDTPATLSDTKFSFDLNADGKKEDISCPEAGSGFLALDLNNNNQIDDGTELFGPTGGNGFQELAQYDQDQNGWIDEADQVFDELKIWEKDAMGKENISSLKQKEIGAICLQTTVAEFGYKNNDDDLLGQSTRAGIFLREDGSAGTIQQVDLVG